MSNGEDVAARLVWLLRHRWCDSCDPDDILAAADLIEQLQAEQRRDAETWAGIAEDAQQRLRDELADASTERMVLNQQLFRVAAERAKLRDELAEASEQMTALYRRADRLAAENDRLRGELAARTP